MPRQRTINFLVFLSSLKEIQDLHQQYNSEIETLKATLKKEREDKQALLDDDVRLSYAVQQTKSRASVLDRYPTVLSFAPIVLSFLERKIQEINQKNLNVSFLKEPCFNIVKGNS